MPVEEDDIVTPGSTIGILGEGQLGKMLAIAAANLGYKTAVMGLNKDGPAMQVATHKIVAPYNDTEALARLASIANVVTSEFENVPDSSLCFLEEQRMLVRPSSNVFRIASNRYKEKSFLKDLGVPTVRWSLCGEKGREVPADFPYPCIVKTVSGGYDGHGQMTASSRDEMIRALQILAGSCIVEQKIDLVGEWSVIVACSPNGVIYSYPPVENTHIGGILHKTVFPASFRGAFKSMLVSQLRGQATELAEKIARSLDVIGLMAVEMFITRDHQILVNELAPRPHNSGHWTIEGCTVSQFEQAVRAICNLPMLPPYLRCHSAEMDNLLGEEVNNWPKYLALPHASVHLYGKVLRKGEESRNRTRKMAHVTIIHD